MLDELLHDIIEHVTHRTMFYGLYRYRVISQTAAFDLPGGGKGGDVVTLQVASEVTGLPGLVAISKGHGLGGATEQLAPSTLVLVAFEGGDPAAPVIDQIVAGQVLPLSITLTSRDAFDVSSTDITIAAQSTASLTAKVTANVLAGTAVYVGGDEMKPAAVGSLVDDRLVTLRAAVNAALGALGLPSIPALGSVGSDRVFITTGAGTPVDPHAP